jgi:predicted nucleic acid-binding protein
LQIGLRRKRFEQSFRDAALAKLARLSIITDGETDTYAWTNTLHLSSRFQLTTYDAAYLELAQRRRMPLASLDQPLRAGAAALGIDLLGIAIE